MLVRIYSSSTEAAQKILQEVQGAIVAGNMTLQQALKLFGLAGSSCEPPTPLARAEFFVETLQTLLRRVETSGPEVSLGLWDSQDSMAGHTQDSDIDDGLCHPSPRSPACNTAA